MKKITFFIMLLTVLWSARAQNFDDTCTSAFEDISSTGTALGLLDDGSDTITIPFDFTLTGITSRHLLVGNNGAVFFGVTSGYISAGNYELTSNNAKPGFYPFWDDIDNDTGDVYWEVKGTAPNRYLVIEWYQRPHYNNIGDATFELILYEGSNDVEFRYLDLDFGDSRYDYGASATIGVKGEGGVYQYSYNTAINSNITCIHWTAPAVYNPAFDLAVHPDCSNNQLFLDVQIISMGGADSLSIFDNHGHVVEPVDSLQTIVLGPYPDSTAVDVTVRNMADTTYATSASQNLYCVSGNDECQYAYELTVFPKDSSAGHETLASTEYATASEYSHTSCDQAGTNYDLFFRFTAPASGKMKIITGGDKGSYIKAVIKDSCDTADEIECFGASTEKALSGLNPGQDYILQVWTDNYYAGDFTIALEEMPYLNPAFDATVRPDCANSQLYVDVNITDMGGADSLSVTDNLGNIVRPVDTLGIVEMGPYPDSTVVTISVTNLTDTTYTTSVTKDLYCVSGNDICQYAYDLTVYAPHTAAGHEVTASTEYASPSDLSMTSCDSYGDNYDLFFRFTAPSSGKMKIMTGGDKGRYIEAVIREGCDTTEVECFSASTEKIVDGLNPGQDYILQVWTDSYYNGDFNIVLEEMVYVNPEFEATVQPDCANNQFNVDIRVTNLGDASSVTVEDDQGSPAQQVTDTITVVHFGPYANGTQVNFTVTNDDDSTYTASQSVQYYCPPANDVCATAQHITIYNDCHVDTVSNYGATDSGVADPGCANYNGADIWFHVLVQRDADIIYFETSGIQGSEVDDTGLAVYSGTCDSLTLISCNDDFGGEYFSQVNVTGTHAGDEFYIRVWEYGSNQFGEFGICAYAPNMSVHNTLSPDEFSFFPNPTRSTITWKAEGSVDKIQLTDMTGQVLISLDNPETHTLDISHLPNGIYLLNVWMNDKKGIYRIIKE